MHLGGDLPIAILDHKVSVSGVDLPGDLPRSALTTILHIKPAKCEPSLLKFLIVIWEGVLGMSGGVKGVTSNMTVQC